MKILWIAVASLRSRQPAAQPAACLASPRRLRHWPNGAGPRGCGSLLIDAQHRGEIFAIGILPAAADGGAVRTPVSPARRSAGSDPDGGAHRHCDKLNAAVVVHFFGDILATIRTHLVAAHVVAATDHRRWLPTRLHQQDMEATPHWMMGTQGPRPAWHQSEHNDQPAHRECRRHGASNVIPQCRRSTTDDDANQCDAEQGSVDVSTR